MLEMAMAMNFLQVHMRFPQPSEVAEFAHWRSMHLWSKTHRTLHAMNDAVALNLSARSSSSSSFPSRHHLISWSIPDPVATSHVLREQGQPLQVLPRVAHCSGLC
jgi:hypothetical protein